jgi:predicted NBD/HSP70 family sugar kinase
LEKATAYKKEIIKELFFNGELSIADIANITQKSLPIAARILNELINDGWIVENGYAISTGGRRPQVFSLAEDNFYIVAVATDQHITQAAIINAKRKVVGRIETLELDLKDNNTALDTLIGFINAFIQKAGIPNDKIAGIGIGMPGFIDANKSINYSFFQNIPGSLNCYIADKTGLPVVIDNDSSIMGLAELRMGAARHKKNAMIINIGWGIGLGMIINGKLFRGDNGFAGEFSHIPLFLTDKMCACGKPGCLEVESSLYVIAEKAIEGINAGKATALKDLALEHIEETVNKILSAAVRGDKFAVELLSESAFNIGRGVAILIHIVNPGQIILTGRGTVAGKIWLAPLQQALNMYCIPRLAENTTVEISSLGYDAGLMGAAALVMENLGRDFIHKADKSKAELHSRQKKLENTTSL